MGVYDTIVEVLSPLVGKPAAEICVHSSAMQVGKGSAALGPADLPVVFDNIREKMRPFASADVLDTAIDEIRRREG